MGWCFRMTALRIQRSAAQKDFERRKCRALATKTTDSVAIMNNIIEYLRCVRVLL